MLKGKTAGSWLPWQEARGLTHCRVLLKLLNQQQTESLQLKSACHSYSNLRLITFMIKKLFLFGKSLNKGVDDNSNLLYQNIERYFLHPS